MVLARNLRMVHQDLAVTIAMTLWLLPMCVFLIFLPLRLLMTDHIATCKPMVHSLLQIAH